MKTRKCVRPRVEELERRLVPSTLTTSTNWSGYAVTAGAGAVTQVSGSWVVPTVSTTVAGYSSSWVGIDGANSNSVEQIGTDSDYVNGQKQYYAWYEMYPSPFVKLSLTVHPGDTMSASVNYTGSNQFALAITDVTTGGSFSTTQTASGVARSSAEWIQEAPSSIFGVLPLANFGTVNFSGANATVAGTTGPADNSWSGTTLYQINMVNRIGALKATTSALSDSGSPATSSFSVTWVSSGAGGHGGGHKSPDAPPPTTAPTSAQLSAALAGLLANAQATPSFIPTAAPVTVTAPVFVTPTAPSASFPRFGASSALSSGVADADDAADSADAAAQPDNLQADQVAATTPRPSLTVAHATDVSFADGFQPTAVPPPSVITAGESAELRLAEPQTDTVPDVFSAGLDVRSFVLAGLAFSLALERAWAGERTRIESRYSV